MPVNDFLSKRRAYRALAEKSISPAVLTTLAEAAHTSPSWGNSQPWRLVTVFEPSALATLKEALTPGNYWALKAPAITAFVTHPDWGGRLDGGREYALFDTGQAALAYQVQAVTEGLYVHPVAGFDQAKAKAALGIPEDFVLVTLVILGWPGSPEGLSEKHLESEKGPRNRKPLSEVFAENRWSENLVPPKKA